MSNEMNTIYKPTSLIIKETMDMLDAKDAASASAATTSSIKEVHNVNEVVSKDKLNAAKSVVSEFHKLWYPLQWTCTWLGHNVAKCPFDLHIYQEIIYECKPDLIIECGTYQGGSALFLASICDMIHHGQVLTIDIAQCPTAPIHPRINYCIGSSVDPKVVELAAGMAESCRKVMVILDSDHSKQHVLDELDIYSHLVTPQQYLIVEDGNIYGNPINVDFRGASLSQPDPSCDTLSDNGPFAAITQFMSNEKNANSFIIDKMCERFLLTFNPNGYLRKVR